MWLEPRLDPLFHDDSYGYRPGKSALEAIAVTRRRCWDQDWVVEFGHSGAIRQSRSWPADDGSTQALSGTLDLALRRALAESANANHGRASLQARDSGTPRRRKRRGRQSWPICSYTLCVRSLGDAASSRHSVRPDTPMTPCFIARADVRRNYVLDRIRGRFQACNLELHPGKTRIVYCKDINPDRGESRHPVHLSRGYYTFRPRKAVDKYGRVYVELLTGCQPRRPQGHAADNPGVARSN